MSKRPRIETLDSDDEGEPQLKILRRGGEGINPAREMGGWDDERQAEESSDIVNISDNPEVITEARGKNRLSLTERRALAKRPKGAKLKTIEYNNPVVSIPSTLPMTEMQVVTGGTGKASAAQIKAAEAEIAAGRKVDYGLWLQTKHGKKKTTKRKRKSTGRSGYRRRPYNGGQPLIVSAGTARSLSGYGAYGLQGNVEGTLMGQNYRLRGFYDSSTDGTAVSGYGAYEVKNNSLMNLIDTGTNPPRVMNTNRGEATIINHREYLGDLLSGSGSPSAFNLQTFALNAGNSSLFPFLGTIAHKFQEWEPRGVLFELKTLSSDYAAALSMGSMFMAADYNSLSPAPNSKIALENMEYADSCKPSRSLIMPIECDPRISTQTHLNVADDLDYEGGDKRLFDLCNVYIGSQGIPTADTPIAEIWVTYEIALFKPIIQNGMPDTSSPSARFLFHNVQDALMFGNFTETAPGSSAGFTVDGTNPADCRLFFPAYDTTYIVVYQITNDNSGTIHGFQIPAVTAVGTITTLSMWTTKNNIQNASQLSSGVLNGDGVHVCDTLLLTVVVKQTGGTINSGSLSFSGSDLVVAGVTKADLLVTGYNPLLQQF